MQKIRITDENIHGFFSLLKLEISGHIHNKQYANLLYKSQLSYEKAKRANSLKQNALTNQFTYGCFLFQTKFFYYYVYCIIPWGSLYS